jgi:hypothetical protein
MEAFRMALGKRDDRLAGPAIFRRIALAGAAWILLFGSFGALGLLAGCAARPLPGRGSVEEGAYINSGLGLSFALPDGWAFMDEEALAAYNDLPDPMPEPGEPMAELASREGGVYDMIASDEMSGSGVLVFLEGLGEAANATEKAYLEAVRGTLEPYEYTFSKPGKAKIAGLSFSRLDCKITVSGEYLNRTYLARKLDGAMLVILVTTNNAPADDVLEAFSKIRD